MKVNDAVLTRLEILMHERGLSPYALANISGVPSTTLYSLYRRERRGQNISIRTIKMLCDGMNIRFPEFFNDPLFWEMEQEIE